MENLSEALKIIVQVAEQEIDRGNCYDRKVTRINKKGEGSHISTGRILPASKWKRVRIVRIPIDEDRIILYVKRLKLVGVED